MSKTLPPRERVRDGTIELLFYLLSWLWQNFMPTIIAMGCTFVVSDFIEK